MIPQRLAIILLTLLVHGAAWRFLSPVSAAMADDTGIARARPGAILADAGSWEKYKRIRRGEAIVEEPATSDQKPETPAGPQPAPAPGPNKPEPEPPREVAPHAGTSSAPEAVGHRPATGTARKRPAAQPVRAPSDPTERGSWWVYYSGDLLTEDSPFYGSHGVNFQWAYSRAEPLPPIPRIVVSMHDAGAGQDAVQVFAPSELGDIEVRNQDAGAHNPNWREWWSIAPNGEPFSGRRIAATLEFLRQRYRIDPGERGIVLEGMSMGGAGTVIQTLTLPKPWRSAIAYTSGRAGAIMPREIAREHPDRYPDFPPDDERNRAFWDSIDFALQAARDPVVRGIHYRHAFSSDDPLSDGPQGNTQLEFVNLVERHSIGGAFTWVKGGRNTYERGLRIPDLSRFETPEQDVTLDRAHPAITRSTGNFPRSSDERVDEARFPRGHYNLGVTWDHAAIVDEEAQIAFPLKYSRRTGFGKGVPDQPVQITVSVTPRRPRNFILRDGETLKWSWDEGDLSGTAAVVGDTVTVDKIPLVSGQPYKVLKIHR